MAARTTALPEPLSGMAEASECTWVQHTKRIVKKVKRHGKVRRVVRRRHWWTCVPQAEASPIPPPVLAPPAATPQPEPEPEANRLAVKSSEYYFVLSRLSVKAGDVTIELNNRGEDPHNLNLQLEGGAGAPLEIPETDSEQRSVANFDLPAGKYRLWCSLPEHEEKGMQTTLTVE
jgi:plastocyanin